MAVAEETGLIVPIGWLVLSEACRQAKLWQDAFPSEPKRSISVNLSAVQFHQSDLVENIAIVLERSGLEGSSLKLEITESVLMETSECAHALLSQLKSLGIKLIIDDFGTGFSSLKYLSQLPIDSLKVNGALTHQMDLEGQGEVIVRAVIALAHTLKMDVTAEDIENQRQWKLLMNLGCEHGQGFFFSKPLSVLDAEELMRNPSHDYAEICRDKKVKRPAPVTGFE